MTEPAFEMKIEGLEKIIKALKAKPPIARVGILGSKKRTDSALSNAAVGAAHEFGTSTLPMRSFLRIPIAERLDKELESSNAFDQDVLKKVIDQKSLTAWTEKVAITAQKIVLEAFDTQGFGKWQALKPETMSRKKVKQILTETQQLRNSIEWDVKSAE